jgi:hypothetical protein
MYCWLTFGTTANKRAALRCVNANAQTCTRHGRDTADRLARQARLAIVRSRGTRFSAHDEGCRRGGRRVAFDRVTGAAQRPEHSARDAQPCLRGGRETRLPHQPARVRVDDVAAPPPRPTAAHRARLRELRSGVRPVAHLPDVRGDARRRTRTRRGSRLPLGGVRSARSRNDAETLRADAPSAWHPRPARRPAAQGRTHPRPRLARLRRGRNGHERRFAADRTRVQRPLPVRPARGRTRAASSLCNKRPLHSVSPRSWRTTPRRSPPPCPLGAARRSPTW